MVGLMVGLLSCAGCGPSFQSSDRAIPLPLAERDAAENGDQPGRWPGWRGNNGSGVATGGSPPIHFSPTEGCRWKVAVPGHGNSSPVVWDRFVLLTSALGDRDPAKLAVLCFDRTDGRLLWQAEAGPSHGATHVKNGYASASVATDGKRIFAFFGGAGLFAYDLSGKPLWRTDLGPLAHQWGTAASPILFGETVIQLCDCEAGSAIAAFDQSTGRQVWRTERPSQGCWTTPVLVNVASEHGPAAEMVVNGTTVKPSGDGLVIGYDPRDGRELWRVRGTTDLVTPTALLSGGLVYSLSGRNGPVIAIRPGGSGDVTDTHIVWKAGRGGPYIPSGIAYRNRLYIVGDAGALTCHNAGSGEVIWRTRLPGVYTASLVAADGRIYATSEQGMVSVFAAADTFELLAQNPLDARCLATPAMADGDLLMRTETDLYCFSGQASATPEQGSIDPPNHKPLAPPDRADKTASQKESAPPAGNVAAAADAWPLFRGDAHATGVAASSLPEKLELLWTFSADKGGFESTAAIVDGTVFVGDTRGKLYAIGLADGRKRWEYSTPLGFTASAAVRHGLLYLGDSDGQFYCVDANSGKLKWKFETQAEINSSANFYRDKVLVGSQDSTLYCLNADTGELAWKCESGDQIRCFPTVVEDRGFVAGCDGQLHVIDLEQGKSVAEVSLEGPTGATPAVLGDHLFVGTEEGTLFAIDWRQAKVLWQYVNHQRSAPYRSSAAVTPQAVIVGSRDKLVHALDPKDGSVLWTFTTKSRVDSSPVVVGERVFVGSADGRLYELELKTGQERWRFEAGGAVVASPAVAAGRLVIGNDNGELFCFGTKQDATSRSPLPPGEG
jgi:outer membrane protein assembly factor BamB